MNKEDKEDKEDKGMTVDTTTAPEEDIEENKTDVDHTPATPIEIYEDMRPVTGKKSPQVQGFGKARKPIR